MPIYAYRCQDCGHAQDFLQKISDGPIAACPACGSTNFQKQVTAAGFQLKGGGWYVTDFRDGGKKDAKKSDAGKETTASADSGSSASGDAKPAESKSGGESSGTSTSSTSTSSETKVA